MMEIVPALSHGDSQSSDGRGVTLALQTGETAISIATISSIPSPLLSSSLSKYTLDDDRLARIKSVAAVESEHQRKRGKSSNEIRVHPDGDTM